MIEIGEDPRQAHLCCMPRQGKSDAFVDMTFTTITDHIHRHVQLNVMNEPAQIQCP